MAGLWDVESSEGYPDTCDGQQGRLFVECDVDFEAAFAGEAEVGGAWSRIVSHPLKAYEEEQPAQWMQLNFVLRQELERQAQPRAGYLPLAAEAGLRDQRVGDYRTMVRAGPMGREHDFRWRLSVLN
jgi:hypothetical protein